MLAVALIRYLFHLAGISPIGDIVLDSCFIERTNYRLYDASRLQAA